MNRRQMTLMAAIALFGAALAAPYASAGLTDALKKKATDKANQQVDKAMSTPVPAAKADTAGKAAKASGDEPASAAPAASGSGSGGVAAVSTKFDYVPGDSVMLWDDFQQDELGEFPAKWKLTGGTWEVAEMGGEKWLRCTSSSGAVRMKVPPVFPEFWTLEFDFYGVDLGGAIALNVIGHDAQGNQVWAMMFPYSGDQLGVRCGSIGAITPVTGVPIEGRHHVMFMGRGTALKVYMDRERYGNIPDVTGQGVPTEIEIALGAPGKPMIGNVRFAEGCRPAKDMLASGKLVTYGIRFATGSDVVLPESAPVLRQVASYMAANTAVKLQITGHTDNVGSAASNLDLSKRRASSVASVLASQFGIAANRFETAGRGDTQPLSNNTKPEGRAMNRRVEFAKL